MKLTHLLSPMGSIMLLLILCAVTSVNSYSKYGRGCSDIGCLPNEVCVLSHDSCSFGQRDGKECGSYPTCKKSGATSANNGGGQPGASVNPAPDNNIFSPSSKPTLHTNTFNTNSGSITDGTTNGNRNNLNTQIDPHYVFGAPHIQPIIPNLPIFPFNQPTQPPAFQQFPQPNHPGSGLSPAFPHNIQPVNPYNPPFIFGPQPFFNPAGTGGPPGSLASGGFQNPNMFNKPPPQYLPNQNPYNRQTQSHRSSAAGGTYNGKLLCIVAGLLSLSTGGGGSLSLIIELVSGLLMVQQNVVRHLLHT